MGRLTNQKNHRNDLTNLKEKVLIKEVLSESDISLIERLDKDLKNLNLEKTNNQNFRKTKTRNN